MNPHSHCIVAWAHCPPTERSRSHTRVPQVPSRRSAGLHQKPEDPALAAVQREAARKDSAGTSARNHRAESRTAETETGNSMELPLRTSSTSNSNRPCESNRFTGSSTSSKRHVQRFVCRCSASGHFGNPAALKSASNIGRQISTDDALKSWITTSGRGRSSRSTKHLLADEGSYFIATNPTPGTALAYNIQAAFSDTVPLFYVQNNGSKANPFGIRMPVRRISSKTVESKSLRPRSSVCSRASSSGVKGRGRV